MTVIVVSAARPSLRGALTRYMLEPSAGVFVGRLSLPLASTLWKRIVMEIQDGSAWMARPASNDQGFTLVHAGGGDRSPVDFDGLTLVRFFRPG